MKQLLIRADDLGYCEAINYAIAKTIASGNIRSVGLMVNMDASMHGYQLVKDHIDCIGQHTNISVGRPVCAADQVPSLVDQDGQFISSKLYNKHNYNQHVVVAELELEIEAQLARFIQLTGKKPDYFEGHAVMSDKFFAALERIADKHGLKYSGFSPDGSPMRAGSGLARVAPMRSGEPDYDPFATLQESLALCQEEMPTIFVAHPGYLDAFVLKSSSLTVNRTRDCEMLCDPSTQQWLRQYDVQLISYNDIP